MPRLKLNELDPRLRERIERQIKADDDAALARKGVAVGGLGGAVAERPAGDRRREDKQVEEAAEGVGVRHRVWVISYRAKAMDTHDNLRAAHKPLVDKVAARLGYAADNDPRLDWRYAQLTGTKLHGTHVVVEEMFFDASVTR